MAVLLVITLVAFIISAKFVPEPIFPLRLLTSYVLITNYVISFLQIMNQFALTMIVPLYFQATNRSSPAAAGAYLIPAFLGNMAGGLTAGYWIKRTGLYKIPTVLAPLCALLAMSLCYFTWQGHTTIPESLAIFPGGFAAGMISSSCFVGLAAGVQDEDVAIASSGMYLFFNIGAIAGSSAGSAVYQTSLRAGLESALKGVEGGREVSCLGIERNAEPILMLVLCRSWSVLWRASRILRLRAIGYGRSLCRRLCTAFIRLIVSWMTSLSGPLDSFADFCDSDVHRLCVDLLCDCSVHSTETTEMIDRH